METLILNESEADKAAKIIKSGGVVAIPTETVYGLAASVFDPGAIKKIFLAKGRPADNPLIVHISNLEDVFKVVSVFNEKAKALAKNFWPGPLTMILPKNEQIPSIVTAGGNSVAVRFPSHTVARKIIELSGVPLVAPSANLSGKPSTTRFSHVLEDLNGKVDALVNGGDCKFGVESTVISLLEDVPRILRPGAITPEQIEKVIGKIGIDDSVFNKITDDGPVLSPGIKYKHYSPDAEVVILKGEKENYADFVNQAGSKEKGVLALCFDEDISLLNVPYISYGSKSDSFFQAHNIFDALRKADKLGAKIVYVHYCESGGVSLAVYNRLIRAAGFKVIDLKK
ncbi:MAG: threonylcarbamoyl-AMP synthase [Clostridia bacterium]|nr:threonylcarbamoyl-AMP synthase [Clostridia bacterium]